MMNIMFDACPDSAPFFGFMGIATAVVFASASRISHVALLRILAEPSMLTRKKPFNGPNAEYFIQPLLLSWFLIFHFSDLGAAYGTAKSGVGLSSMGVMKV
jgi:hypothetical protein